MTTANNPLNFCVYAYVLMNINNKILNIYSYRTDR